VEQYISHDDRLCQYVEYWTDAHGSAHVGLKLEKLSWSASEGDFAVKASFRRS